MKGLTNKNHWILEQLEHNPEKVFIETESDKFTFKEVYQNSLFFFNKFSEFDLQKNSRILIQTSHSPNSLFAVIGAWLCGLTPVVIDSKLTQSETEVLLKLTDCVFKIEPEIFNPEFNTILQKNFAEFNSANEALVICTSGSTGKPKAVLHTFKSLFQSALNSDSLINHTTNDKWLASLPFYHIGGFLIFIRALIFSSQICISENLSTEKIAESMKYFNPTLCSLVPTMFDRLLTIQTNPWEKLKLLFLGGGPINSEFVIKQIKKGWPIAKVYGSSETGAMVTGICKEDILVNPDSCGNPFGDVKIKIENENIFVKSNSLFSGYLDGDKLISPINNDGYFNTQDLGKLNETGLTIFSRRNNLILTGGKNVDPLEVQEIILTNFDVDDVIVYPTDNIEWGQIVTAAIVLKPEKTYSETEIKSKLKSKISAYKVPKKILFIREIPLTKLGKIDYKKLKKLC